MINVTTPQEGFEHLILLIENNLKHELADEAVKIAEQAQIFVSRDKQKQRTKILSYRLRENETQQAQRMRLTNPVTSVLLSPVISTYQSVWRTDGVTKDAEGNDRVDELLSGHFERYQGGNSLHKYAFDTALRFNLTDPNGWLIFDYTPAVKQDGSSTITDMYPVEVYSDEAINWAYDKTGQLIYLAFCIKHQEVAITAGRAQKRTLTDYYLYGRGYVVHFAEHDPDVYGPDAFPGYDGPMSIRGKEYLTNIFLNNTLEVPARRLGAYPSTEHKGRLFDPLFADAIPILEDALRDKSFYDVMKAAHVFPEKVQYVKRCNHVDEQSGEECLSGYLAGVRHQDSICPKCAGTGKLVPSSEQDVLTLEWPMAADEIFDLAKLSHYVERPIDIPVFYREELISYRRDVFFAVFNQQQVDVEQVVQPMTATQSRLDYDKIYNKLSDFAESVARSWEKGWGAGYQYYGITSYQVNMTYPADFKMKTEGELLAELKAAKDSGAPYPVIWSITRDLLEKQHRNLPDLVAEVEAFERFRPWKSKTPEEVMMILQGRDVLDPQRALWEHWDEVLTLIMEDTEFRMIQSAMQQRELLYAKALELAAQVQQKQAAPMVELFPREDEEDEEDEDEQENQEAA